MSIVTKNIMRVLSIITAAIMLLTGTIDMFSQHKRHPEVSKQNILLMGALERSQGVTNDGESYFFSSKFSIVKTHADGETAIVRNYSAIPKKYKDDYGIAHIGGISYYNGKIYAGLEDSKVWDFPIVGVYNSETLEFEKGYILDSSIHDRGMPWVAVDPQTGYLYAGDNSRVANNLYVYDVNNEMKFVKVIELQESVERIQGAEFYKGVMYAATNDETQAIYAINIESGSVSKYFDRNLTSGSEGEGITVWEREDGAVFHAIDMGPLFVNAYLRHYAEL